MKKKRVIHTWGYRSSILDLQTKGVALVMGKKPKVYNPNLWMEVEIIPKEKKV